MLIPAVWDLWTLGVVLAFKSSSFGRRRPLLHEKPLLSHLVAGLLKIIWKEGISGHGIAEYASGISREGILFQHFIFLFFQETSPIGKIQTDCFSKRKNRVSFLFPRFARLPIRKAVIRLFARLLRSDIRLFISLSRLSGKKPVIRLITGKHFPLLL